MLKIIAIQWGLHDGDLRNALFKRTDLDVIKYKDLVKLSFEVVYNNDLPFEDYVADVERIHEIDDGDYQGTLLYLIPCDRYQPEAYEYLMTYVGYGSCSGCDALQSIQMYTQIYDSVRLLYWFCW